MVKSVDTVPEIGKPFWHFKLDVYGICLMAAETILTEWYIGYVHG